MHIYRCDLTLMEATFFSSREISNLYQTEPLIGNYALAYAFRFVQSNYHNEHRVHYREHLSKLNNAGVYVTPATILGQPRFILRQFNAQTDAYWSAFGTGFIAARSQYGWSRKDGTHWYPIEEGERGSRFRPTNRPQHGRIRMLAVGNRARCYVLSQNSQTLPRYIRLGKFMSKARVDVSEVTYEEVMANDQHVTFLLNPADVPSDMQMRFFDLVNVPPMPLVRNAVLSGQFYRLSKDEWLPMGMRFNVDESNESDQ